MGISATVNLGHILIRKIRTQTTKNSLIKTKNIFMPWKQMHRYTHRADINTFSTKHVPWTSSGHFWFMQCSCSIIGWNVKHGLLAELWHYVVSTSARKQNYRAVMRSPRQTGEQFHTAVLTLALAGRTLHYIQDAGSCTCCQEVWTFAP